MGVRRGVGQGCTRLRLHAAQQRMGGKGEARARFSENIAGTDTGRHDIKHGSTLKSHIARATRKGEAAWESDTNVGVRGGQG